MGLRVYVTSASVVSMKKADEGGIWDTSSNKAPGSLRLMAPELLDGSQPTVTNEADIYAYAMACYVCGTYGPNVGTGLEIIDPLPRKPPGE